jgi:hypothetical protein
VYRSEALTLTLSQRERGLAVEFGAQALSKKERGLA